MVYTVMACIVMAYIVMACSAGEMFMDVVVKNVVKGAMMLGKTVVMVAGKVVAAGRPCAQRRTRVMLCTINAAHHRNVLCCLCHLR